MDADRSIYRRWPGFLGGGGVLLVGLLLLQAALLGVAPQAAAALGGRVVVLDPGHGGDESGAVGGGIVERDSNLDLALRVQALLEQRGVRVLLTRTSAARAQDPMNTMALSGYSATFADLQARIAIANLAQADAFVSIHSNAFRDPSVRGLEAWYDANRPFSGENRQLATLCIDGVSRALQAAGYSVPTRGAVNEVELLDAAGSGMPLLVLGPTRDISREELIKSGGDPAALQMGPSDPAFHTAATLMPGTLIELLYVSNAADVALLKDDAARAAIARGIADGITRFLSQRGDAFAAAPIFGTGDQALAVFNGGGVDLLDGAAFAAGATGVWAQDTPGTYRLLIVGGPAFINDTFKAGFPRGFVGLTAVTLIR